MVRTGRIWHQYSDVNGRGRIVLIPSLLKVIMRCTRRQDNIGWIVEVDSVSGKGDYCKRHIDEVNDLISLYLTPRGLRLYPYKGLGL